MKQAESFYNQYWEKRGAENRLYVIDGNWVPKRFFIASKMIQDTQPSPDASVLDLGCGDGTLGKLLRKDESSRFIMGLDISEIAIQNALPYYDKTATCDFEADPFDPILQDRQFDYIVCMEVLEHLFDPYALLGKVKGCLKPGGYLIASFPNIAWWRYRLELLRGEFPREYSMYQAAEHIQNFTLASFTELLEAAGFERRNMECEYKFPPLLKRLHILRKAMGRFPGLFGHQIVVQSQRKEAQ